MPRARPIPPFPENITARMTVPLKTEQSDTTDKVGGLMSGVASKAIAPMN